MLDIRARISVLARTERCVLAEALTALQMERMVTLHKSMRNFCRCVTMRYKWDPEVYVTGLQRREDS